MSKKNKRGGAAGGEVEEPKEGKTETRRVLRKAKAALKKGQITVMDSDSVWEQEMDLGPGITEPPPASLDPAESESSSDSDKSDMPDEELEEENCTMLEEDTKSDQKQGATTWQRKQHENRTTAAQRLPLLRSLLLRIQEGFHPGVQCSTRDCAEAKLLLRCLGCSPTLLFCSVCWVLQHRTVRTQHTPEVYIDGWRTVTHFLRSESPDGLDAYYPVCVASPAADLEELKGAGAEFVALNGVLTAPPWLISCVASRGNVKLITVITVGHVYPTYTVRIEHCDCDEHPFLTYLLIQRLFPLTFKDPSTALTFELMDHLDQLMYAHDPVQVNSVVESILGHDHQLLGNVKNFILHAVHIYHECKRSTQDLSCLNLSKLGLEFCTTPACPVCFQRSAEKQEITSCTYDAIRIVREKKSDATIIDGVDTHTCGLIASPSQTQQLETAATARVEAKESEFKTFRDNGCGIDRKFKAMTSLQGKKSTDHDQHGFISMICSHGLVLCSIMMAQHECFLFSIMLLSLLQQHFKNPKIVLLLYDVMCRAAPYLFAHMGDIFVRYVALPVWHALAHIPSCASRFSCASIIAAGDLDGEQTERFHSFMRKFGASLKRQTAAMYFRSASRAMEAWNTLKSARFRKNLNSSYTKLLNKKKIASKQADIEEEFVKLEEPMYTDSQINALYTSYRTTAESSMIADKYKSTSASSSSSLASSTVAAVETKVAKPDLRIQYVDKHKQLAATNAQLRVYESLVLTQQQRKQREKLLKNQAKLSKSLRQLSKSLKLDVDKPDFLTSEIWVLMLAHWTNEQLTVRLPKAIHKLRVQWRHALWVSDKPQLRDIDSTSQAKQKHAAKQRNNAQLKRANLIAKISLFNETLQETPVSNRPFGMKEIDTHAPLEQAMKVGLGPYYDCLLDAGETPVELKRLFSLKDKLSRIERGLEINIEDRKYLSKYLEAQQTDLKILLAHSHFDLSNTDSRAPPENATDTYARRGLLSGKLREISTELSHVRADITSLVSSTHSSSSSMTSNPSLS